MRTKWEKSTQPRKKEKKKNRKRKIQEKLKEAGNKKSMVNFFLENKREWKAVKRAEYMDRLNRMEASTIFKARSRMVEVKKQL